MLILKWGDRSMLKRNSGHMKKCETIPQHLQRQPSLNSSENDGNPEDIDDENVLPPNPKMEIREPLEPPETPNIHECSPILRHQHGRRSPQHFDSYELYWTLIEECCARTGYQGRGQVIIAFSTVTVGCNFLLLPLMYTSCTTLLNYG